MKRLLDGDCLLANNAVLLDLKEGVLKLLHIALLGRLRFSVPLLSIQVELQHNLGSHDCKLLKLGRILNVEFGPRHPAWPTETDLLILSSRSAYVKAGSCLGSANPANGYRWRDAAFLGNFICENEGCRAEVPSAINNAGSRRRGIEGNLYVVS